jgi:serine/threonine protein kinase
MDCMRNHFYDGVLLHNKYRTICPLNHGSFGLVFKAEDVTTGQPVALKCILKSSAATSVASSFAVDEKSEELAIHRHIGSHPNIVNLVDSFETENHVYLVIEYCPNGDLYEAIRVGHGPGQTENIRDALLQLIDSVLFMHSKGVYHRDIKPENILLSSDGSIKLGDFGLATREEVSFESAVGSDRYMAPEQMDPTDAGYSPRQVDAWAIGICLLNILFSRNPFATPTLSDPLFSDFAADRQTLFDIFPNMSQDTFDVLIHCLALEPENRSLELAKDAVLRAVSFTTDDETLDEFCVAPAVTATANREPLRTPSLSSPQVDSTGAFPWAKALAMTTPARQLSVIEDVDFQDEYDVSGAQDFYPASQVDTNSLVSFVDSGLGLSVKSSNMSLNPEDTTRSKPMPISGSLPAARPIYRSMASIFRRDDTPHAKSWSDMFDEDLDMGAQSEPEQNYNGFFPRRVSMDSLDSVSNGSDTPRMGLSELKNPDMVNNARVRTPDNVTQHDDSVSEHTGFLFEEHSESMAVKTPTPMPKLIHKNSSSPKRSVLDRWAALGDRRRQPTPDRSTTRMVSVLSPTLNPSNKRPRTNTTSARKNASWSIWGQGQKNWNVSTGSIFPESKKLQQHNLSKDWRKQDALSGAPMDATERGRPLEWVWRI